MFWSTVMCFGLQLCVLVYSHPFWSTVTRFGLQLHILVYSQPFWSTTTCFGLQSPVLVYNHLQPPVLVYNHPFWRTTIYNHLFRSTTMRFGLQPPIFAYVAAGWWWWMMGQVILLDTDIPVQYQDWNIYILALLFYPLVWSSTDKYVWYNCKNYRKLCQLMPTYASLDQLMPAWSALVTPWKILGVWNYMDLSVLYSPPRSPSRVRSDYSDSK